MKKALGAIAVLLVLTGCSSGSDSSAPKKTLTIEEIERIKEKAFVEVVRDKAGVRFAFASDEEVVGIGRGICNILNNGGDPKVIVITIADGFNAPAEDIETLIGDASALYGASTAAFCPEYNGTLGEL